MFLQNELTIDNPKVWLLLGIVAFFQLIHECGQPPCRCVLSIKMYVKWWEFPLRSWWLHSHFCELPTHAKPCNSVTVFSRCIVKVHNWMSNISTSWRYYCLLRHNRDRFSQEYIDTNYNWGMIYYILNLPSPFVNFHVSNISSYPSTFRSSLRSIPYALCGSYYIFSL